MSHNARFPFQLKNFVNISRRKFLQVIWELLNAFHTHRELRLASKNHKERVHNLLLVSSHLCFRFLYEQRNQPIFILCLWQAIIPHSLTKSDRDYTCTGNTPKRIAGLDREMKSQTGTSIYQVLKLCKKNYEILC